MKCEWKSKQGTKRKDRKRNVELTNELINADNLINSGCVNGDICVAAFFVFVFTLFKMS